MRLWKSMVVMGLGVLLLAGSAHAYVDEYDDYTDSHPLRIIAYAIHPVGYTLEWLALRPLRVLTSQPELQPIFGTDPYGPGFRDYDLSSGEVAVAPAPQPAISASDLEALRRAAQDAQAAADEAKRAAEEAQRAAEEAARAAAKSDRAFEKSLMK